MTQINIDEDAASLRKAMKGLGTDEDTIIKIVANRTNSQRQQIKISFKNQFNRDLISDLKSELRGKLEDAIIALFTEPIEYDCIQLKKAMKGAGTDEDTLIEIIATRPNNYLQQLHKKYREIYNKELISDIHNELSGELRDLMTSLLQGARDNESKFDEKTCIEKAEKLYKAGEGKIGTNEKVFYDILIKSSPNEIIGINNEYCKISKKNLIQAIDSEFSGKVKKLLKTAVYGIVNPSEYFATRVREAVKGLGTNDKLLMRILITRDEIDMPQIKEAYKRLYDRDLVNDVKNDLSGDYKKLMVELCSH
jgi:annexin A7/11